MQKNLLILTLLTLFGTHVLEAGHNKTQATEAASTQVVEVAQTAAALQALQEIVKSPEDVRQLVTQLEQHKEVKSWLARNKTLLIGTSICAAAIATNIMWFMAHKKAIAELKSAENAFQNTRSAHDNLQQQYQKLQQEARQLQGEDAARTIRMLNGILTEQSLQLICARAELRKLPQPQSK